MDTQTLANIIGYAAATIGAIMFMPQAITIWKTKQTKGVSLMSFSLLAIVSCLWFAYGILMHATPVVLVNAIIAILSVFIIFMKLKYK
jgi:MtN3 and saliva related transmembrane protein